MRVRTHMYVLSCNYYFIRVHIYIYSLPTARTAAVQYSCIRIPLYLDLSPARQWSPVGARTGRSGTDDSS